MFLVFKRVGLATYRSCADWAKALQELNPTSRKELLSSLVGRAPPAEKFVASTAGKRGCRCLEGMVHDGYLVDSESDSDAVPAPDPKIVPAAFIRGN